MSKQEPSIKDLVLTKSEIFIALGTGIITFIVYLFCLCPTVGPGDAGELTLAALRLGIPHPPGYPLFTWLGRLATLLPFSEPALVTNLLTLIIAALAVSLLYFISRWLIFSRTGSFVTSITFGFSITFWNNATSHEVYSFTIFLLVLLLLLVLKANQGDFKIFLLVSFVFGLAIGHQPTALLWLPGLLLLAGKQSKISTRTIPILLIFFILGLSSSLGTLLRAQAGPEFNWENPNNLIRFFQHITAAQYQELSFGVSSQTFWHRLIGLPGLWLAEFGIPALILLITGIVSLFILNRSKLFGLLLITATSLFGITYNIPDFKPHLLSSFVGLALLIGAGATWIQQNTKRYHQIVVIIIILICPAYTFIKNLEVNLENRTFIVKDLAENYLTSLPADAVFIYGADVNGNALNYVRTINDTKSDLSVISAEMLFSPIYWEKLAKNIALPSHESVLHQAGFNPREERKFILLNSLVERIISSRPVYLSTDLMKPEMFNSPLMNNFKVIPQGIVNQLISKKEDIVKDEIIKKNQRLWDSYKLGSVQRNFRQPDYENIQVIYASSRNNFGMFCLQQGWQEEAIKNLDEVLKFPVSEWFKAIVRQNRTRAVRE
jgi:hypothetical protein